MIDSAAGWDYKQSNFKNKDIMGYGIVPISISDILQTESDEIRFVVYGSSESYRTANYAIPVPKDDDGKFPFIARASLCYFPECTRSQGVDYTNRELSLKFGRINAKGSIGAEEITSTTGDIVLDENAEYVISGDCTVTVKGYPLNIYCQPSTNKMVFTTMSGPYVLPHSHRVEEIMLTFFGEEPDSDKITSFTSGLSICPYRIDGSFSTGDTIEVPPFTVSFS